MPQEEDEKWPEFQSSRGFGAPFGEQQQNIILANDKELQKLCIELVPNIVTAEQFWIRWRLWQHIRNQQIVAPNPLAKNLPILDDADDWDSWE
jgi:hypothetical protein